MHDDPFPAAEKILSDIENVFKRDKFLNDFEILPVPVGENKSPVVHAEHNLGLQEWCVRHLYLHVYHKLITLKRQQRLRREDPKVLSRLLLGGVLLNPDCSLLWNIRRDFVVMGRFDPCSELHINAIALSRRPKTAEAFVYRRWILNRVIATPLDPATSAQVFEEELRVCLMAADRYANNYHAWNHRMWIMAHLPLAQDGLVEEWCTSEKWISSHISEHSGLQYREYLLKQIIQSLGHSDLCLKVHQSLVNYFSPLVSPTCGVYGPSFKHSSRTSSLHSLLLEIFDKKQQFSLCPIHCEQSPFILHIALLAYEQSLVTELINLYPGHEALWCHRRFVLHSFYSLIKKVNADETDIREGVPLPKAQKLSVLETDHSNHFLWKVVSWHEDELVKGCLSVVPQECYQRKLAHRHQKWIEKALLSKNSEEVTSNS